MSNIAIHVEGLSKLYRLGEIHKRFKYKTLREVLSNAFFSSFKRLRNVINNSSVKDSGSDEVIWALKDVSFQVKKGEVLGIIGRNGAGKSTLLKLLSRITEPTSGFAELYGRVGSLLEVGTGFHPELTGRENIYLSGTILGMRKSEIDKQFDKIVDFAEIAKFIDTPVKHYSSGMYVRLAFSVAAHLQPEILLVDEVLAVGDFAFQKKCLGKMQDVVQYGRTIMFVSHNMGAIKTLCDRCILLEDGRILADGPSDEVIEIYLERGKSKIQEKKTKKIVADYGKRFTLHYREEGGDVAVFCGDPIVLEFDIEAPEPIGQDSLGIGISVVNTLGDPIVSMNNLVQKIKAAPGNSRVWRVRCDMGNIPLNAGVYFVCVDIGDDKRGSRAAKFMNAFTIRVMEYDVFGWGSSLPNPRYWGPFYWAPKWDIKPAQ